MAWSEDVFQTSKVVSVNLAQANANFDLLRASFASTMAPSAPATGQWWFDAGNGILKLRTSTAWQSVWDFDHNCPVISGLASASDAYKISIDMLNAALKSPAANIEGLRSLGSAAGTACEGNDSRLSNDRALKYNSQVVDTPISANTLVGRNDYETSYTGSSYVMAKSFSILQPGTYRYACNIKSSNALLLAYYLLYRNGSPIGTIKSTNSEIYSTIDQLSDDPVFPRAQTISGWSIGDTMEMMIKSEQGHGTVYIKDFRLYVKYPVLGVPAGRTHV